MPNIASGKILSVTIPTWNRASILPGILDQICFQITKDNLEELVEVFISNNGSSDQTETICLEYKAKFPFINYHNNGENIGARNNVLMCFDKSNAEYLILFGDDDRINDNALKSIIDFLKSNPEINLFLDTTPVKSNPFQDGDIVNLKQFTENFYYYLGNAGLFIYKSSLAKEVLKKHPFDFFNKSWPQTQLMILGIRNISVNSCALKKLNINAPGLHNQVMVYNSYYLYRTTYFDLIDSIKTIKNEIDPSIYKGAKLYLNQNVSQIFMNILQCGIFVDSSESKTKTRNHIIQNLETFEGKGKLLMLVIAFALWIPAFLSKPIANIFIFATKGNAGLNKKNEFVMAELIKKKNLEDTKSKEIREFSF